MNVHQVRYCPESIVAYAGNYCEIDIKDMYTATRRPHVVRARSLACWLLRRLTDLSYWQIADLMGWGSHTSSLWAERAAPGKFGEMELAARLDDFRHQTIDMPIRSVVPWFGGKRGLAPDIVLQLGRHDQYFEPCGGGLSVLLHKAPCQIETVNDLHGDLINLARIIQSPEWGPALYDMLERTFMTEWAVEEAQRFLRRDFTFGTDLSEMHLKRAFWYFVASWMGRSGFSGTERADMPIAVRWNKNGGSPTARWSNAVGSIPAWHRRLQNVMILRRDAFNIIPKIQDAAGVAVYVDPPYMLESRTSAADPTGRYQHDFTDDEHDRLAEMLGDFSSARVVVSYYDCPRVRELYRDWTFIEKSRKKNLDRFSGSERDRNVAPELLIVNGDEHVDTEAHPLFAQGGVG